MSDYGFFSVAMGKLKKCVKIVLYGSHFRSILFCFKAQMLGVDRENAHTTAEEVKISPVNFTSSHMAILACVQIHDYGTS